jgi:hypothetical protein
MKSNNSTNNVILPKGISKETTLMINAIIDSLPDKLSNKVDVLSIYMLARNYELMLISWNDICKNKLVDKLGDLNKHYMIYKNMSTSIIGILKELGLTSTYKKYFSDKLDENKTALDSFFDSDINEENIE